MSKRIQVNDEDKEHSLNVSLRADLAHGALRAAAQVLVESPIQDPKLDYGLHLIEHARDALLGIFDGDCPTCQEEGVRLVFVPRTALVDSKAG
jgi:hypothetical protein